MILYTTDIKRKGDKKNVVLEVELWGWVMFIFCILPGVGQQNFVPLRGVGGGGGSCFFEEPGFHFLGPTPPPLYFLTSPYERTVHCT